MLILAKLMGVLIVVMGIIFLLSPKTMKQYIIFWAEGKRLHMGAVLSILIGIIFLLAASQSRLVGIIVAMGIISLIKGFILFILGIEKIKSMLKWWETRPLLVIRLWAVLAICIGALIVYSA